MMFPAPPSPLPPSSSTPTSTISPSSHHQAPPQNHHQNCPENHFSFPNLQQLPPPSSQHDKQLSTTPYQQQTPSFTDLAKAIVTQLQFQQQAAVEQQKMAAEQHNMLLQLVSSMANTNSTSTQSNTILTTPHPTTDLSLTAAVAHLAVSAENVQKIGSTTGLSARTGSEQLQPTPQNLNHILSPSDDHTTSSMAQCNFSPSRGEFSGLKSLQNVPSSSNNQVSPLPQATHSPTDGIVVATLPGPPSHLSGSDILPSEALDAELIKVLQQQNFEALKLSDKNTLPSSSPRQVLPSSSDKNEVFRPSSVGVEQQNSGLINVLPTIFEVEDDSPSKQNHPPQLTTGFGQQSNSTMVTSHLLPAITVTTASSAFPSSNAQTVTIPGTLSAPTSATATPKPSFASLFRPTPPVTPPSISQLPIPYKKGNLLAVKLNESAYQTSLQRCKTNLIGRLMLHRGATPIKTVDLHSTLANGWKTIRPWLLTPMGKGYYNIHFENKDDMQKVWTYGQTNVTNGVFKLLPWSPDFVPNKQKQTTARVWARLHDLSWE